MKGSAGPVLIRVQHFIVLYLKNRVGIGLWRNFWGDKLGPAGTRSSELFIWTEIWQGRQIFAPSCALHPWRSDSSFRADLRDGPRPWTCGFLHLQ